ncbi:MAG: helix-turn-helix transcriptional regulator [Clostridia bacterium]|nr:helix-turn-helix transcriptional regulator [Clostridia bacterium]
MRLKELRQERSLYQKDIAAHLGIDRTTYVKYEKESSEPPIATLIELCRFYSVTMDYLLGVTDIKCQNDLSHDFNETEVKLIENFRSLNKQGKEYILQTMAMSVSIYKNDTVPDVENL